MADWFGWICIGLQLKVAGFSQSGDARHNGILLMGLGGDLLWTPVLRALAERSGAPVELCDRPRLGDIILHRGYDGASKRCASPVFKNNPNIVFPETPGKGVLTRSIDRVGELATGFNRLRGWHEQRCYEREKKACFSRLYLDLPRHSYVERIEQGAYIWKKGGHIIDILAASVGLTNVPHQCEMFFSDDEEKRLTSLMTEYNLQKFVAVEPSTNREFFGALRAWPVGRWQIVVDGLRKEHPWLSIVQLGLDGSPILAGSINMTGKTSFREAALLIKASKFFMGTEGGLMHAANAVRSRGVILWGGLTTPEFAAYPEMHKVIHHPVECAPCGLLGACGHDHKCMLSISTGEVIEAARELLV